MDKKVLVSGDLITTEFPTANGREFKTNTKHVIILLQTTMILSWQQLSLFDLRV